MDYYSTLGIDRSASPDDIKKAYRRLASQHHPDKGGDTAMFQKIEEAYRVLSDPAKKQEYDNPASQFSGFNFHENIFGHHINPEDIFSQVFGQHFGHPFAHQRSHRHVFRTQLSVTLEDAYRGSNQTMKIQTPTEQKLINIEIPKGVQDRSQVRYDNIIENATLVIEFKILPNLKFERRENDLYCNQSISILDLIVGTTIKFTTISGKDFEVIVPPKTQPYMQLKIAGQGMPIQGTSSYGDQILLLKPFIPDNIDEEITQSILRAKAK